MKAASLTLVMIFSSSCVRHVYPYKPKVREYQQDTYAAPEAGRTEGSLFGEASRGLFEDVRGHRIGDILTIRVDERSDATRDLSTKSSRKNEANLGVNAFFTAMTALQKKNPGLDPSALIAATSNTAFDGEGSTKRSGKLNATLPVRIKKTLPNGDFYVEGNKILLLNEEESHLYISGVVRPVDIAPDNSIPSFLLADVELEYTGRGVLSDRQSPGWLGRALDMMWPF